MEDLGDDSEHDDLIMAGLESAEIKSEHGEPVSIKVLWSHSDSNSHLSHFEIPEGIKVKSPTTDEEHSLSNHDIGENSGDPILDSEGELSELKQEPGDEDDDQHELLPAEHMNGVHILPVSEDGSILTDASESIHVASSMGGELGDNVIQYLLPTTGHQRADSHEAGLHGVSISLRSVGLTGGHVLGPAIQEVQAITLADGNTAFIQPPAGSKFLEGQTITLEDGSTAVVQSIGSQVASMNLINTSMSSMDTTSTVSMLDENTSSFINQAVKDNLQAIILEDGTTAYLATQPSAAGGLHEGRHLEPTTLTSDQLNCHVSGVHSVLSNGAIINMYKRLSDPLSGESQATTVGAYPDMSSSGGDKISSTATVVQSIDGDKVGQLILEKGYCCKFDGCGRYYTTLHHLRVHERSHTGDRPFKCDFERCDKAFATGYGLKSHMRVHTGEKPYKCPQQNCDKAFKTSGDLQKHVRTHTGEKPFKCPFVGCDRSFTTSNIRKVHIRTHTGERPYICPEEDCGRAFASATNYKNHVRIHTGEKPYVCTVMGCGKRFTEYSSLYKHHVVHTHSKPYTCERCGKTYRQTSTLAMHKRTTHGENVIADGEELIYQDGSKGFTDEDGMVNGDNDDGESLEPPGKKQRLSFLNVSQESGVVGRVINSSNLHQQFALVDGLSMLGEGLQASLNNQTLLQHGGLAFTLGDNTQQVFVITDPAQLEALQQIAKHQIDNEAEENALLINPTSSESSVFESPGGVTLVTEIGGSEIDHGKDDFTGSISSIELSSKSPGSLCIDNL